MIVGSLFIFSIVILILFLFFFLGLRKIGPNQKGIVIRKSKYRFTAEPSGMYFIFPFIDRIKIIDIGEYDDYIKDNYPLISCPKCNTNSVPFGDITCPNCGIKIEEEFSMRNLKSKEMPGIFFGFAFIITLIITFFYFLVGSPYLSFPIILIILLVSFGIISNNVKYNKITKSKLINKILLICVILLFIVNLIFLTKFRSSLMSGYDRFNVFFGTCIISIIIIPIFITIVIILSYKKIIGRKFLTIFSIILIISLSVFISNIYIDDSIEGTEIYKHDYRITKKDINGEYITWNSRDQIYLLKIDEQSANKIGSGIKGPVIYEDNVFFVNDDVIYKYSIQEKETKKITNGSGVSLDVYDENLIWLENQSIHLFNTSSKQKTIIKSKNITLPIFLSEKHIVWSEYVDALYNFDSPPFSKEIAVYNIFSYNLNAREKNKILSNVNLTKVENSDLIIEVYKDKLYYVSNLIIYEYNLSTDDNKEIIKHTKFWNSVSCLKHGYISELLVSNNYLVYNERHYNSGNFYSYDECKHKVYNLKNGKTHEIDISVDNIYENYVIYTKNNGFDLYLLDLEETRYPLWLILPVALSIMFLLVGIYFHKKKLKSAGE